MNSKITHIAVIGGGSWATAIIKILSENNVKIRWWLRNQADLEHIRTFHHNPRYLSGVQLDAKKVEAVGNLSAAIQDAEYVLCPVCKSVSPIDEDQLDYDRSSHGTKKGGIGLGFDIETLQQFQKQKASFY